MVMAVMVREAVHRAGLLADEDEESESRAGSPRGPPPFSR
jgi:hypothetical protein